MGIGSLRVTNPSGGMISGQTLLTVDVPLTDAFGVVMEVGYSGERPGRYDPSRHFVVGGGIRYGSVFGWGAIVHGMLGRTNRESSGGLRIGGRFDLYYSAGIDVQYEWRQADAFPGAQSGIRFIFWFDPVTFIRVVNGINHL